jgi:membrane protein
MLKWLEELEDGLFVRSRDMGGPWGPVLRVVRYPAALIRDWLRGEISVQAMSLAYTTLLSIVPLMVFSFSILKGLGARGGLRYLLNEFFRPVGGAAAQLTENVLQFVNNMRGDIAGTIGLAFLVYTVVSTIQKVEASFNFVWRVDRPRSFMRRFVEYLSVMILGPILLAVALGLLGTAEHSPIAQRVNAIAVLAATLNAVGSFIPYLIVTVVFTFMYTFVPNTKVRFRCALIGGVTAGVIWALVGRVFTAFIVYSSSLVAIYTGFAIVLTTLIWVYLSWLILLIGAQLAFYLQFPQYLRHGQQRLELSGREREQVGLAIMYLIARDYAKGETPWSSARLAAILDIPGNALAPVVYALESNGFVIATEREHFVPGRNLDGIRLRDVLEAIRSSSESQSRMPASSPRTPATGIMKEIDAAIDQTLGDKTLQELIAQK